MTSYLMAIKDRNNIYKISTHSRLLHEDAALTIMYELGKYEFSELPSIELAKMGYLTIKVSTSAIVLTLPKELNDDLISYLNKIKEYLESNYDMVWIIDINNINENDYFGDSLSHYSIDEIIKVKQIKNK